MTHDSQTYFKKQQLILLYFLLISSKTSPVSYDSM